MIKRIGSVIGKKVNNVHLAAYVIGISTFLSLLIALLRDRLLVYKIGTGPLLDIYYTAFKIPDILFALLASFLSAFVLIPYLNGKKDTTQRAGFLSALIVVFLLISVVFIVLIWWFTFDILQTFYPNLANTQYLSDFIYAQKVLLLQFLILGISALFTSMVQMQNKFVAFSLAPIFYNLGIIIGVVYLYDLFGTKGLMYGVLLGAIANLLLTLGYAGVSRSHFTLPGKSDFADVFKFIHKVYPRTISLVLQKASIFLVFMSLSSLGYGAVSLFQLAFNIQTAPFSIIAVSYSVAAFPTLSKFYANKNMRDFVAHINLALRHIVFWSVPIVVLTLVLRAHIVRLILGSGNFSWQDTKVVAAILAVLIIALIFQSINILFIRGYYSASFTRLPLLVTAINSVIFVVGTYLLIKFISAFESVAILLAGIFKLDAPMQSVLLSAPLAFLLGAVVSSIVFVMRFKADFSRYVFNMREWKAVWQVLFSGLAMLSLAKILTDFLASTFGLTTFLSVFMQTFVVTLVSLLVYGYILYKFNNLELNEALRILKRRCKI